MADTKEIEKKTFDLAKKISEELGYMAMVIGGLQPEFNRTAQQKQVARLSMKYSLKSLFYHLGMIGTAFTPESDFAKRLAFNHAERTLKFFKDAGVPIDNSRSDIDPALKTGAAAAYAEQRRLPLVADYIRSFAARPA